MCELTPKISCTMTRPARGALGGAARYPASRWPSSAVRVMVTPMASSSLSALSTDPWRIGPRNPLDNPPPVRHFLPTLPSRGDQMAQHRDVSTRLPRRDRKSTRLNSSHLVISYAVFCLKKKKNTRQEAD